MTKSMQSLVGVLFVSASLLCGVESFVTLRGPSAAFGCSIQNAHVGKFCDSDVGFRRRVLVEGGLKLRAQNPPRSKLHMNFLGDIFNAINPLSSRTEQVLSFKRLSSE